MPRDGTGSDTISPMTLYGVFLKNKVNKTWSAKLQILIICLWLWGRRGDAARMRKKVSRREGTRDMKHMRREWENKRGRRAEMCWCFQNLQTSVRWRWLSGTHAAVFRHDCGRTKREAGCCKPQNCTESAKLCFLKINMAENNCILANLQPMFKVMKYMHILVLEFPLVTQES